MPENLVITGADQEKTVIGYDSFGKSIKTGDKVLIQIKERAFLVTVDNSFHLEQIQKPSYILLLDEQSPHILEPAGKIEVLQKIPIKILDESDTRLTPEDGKGLVFQVDGKKFQIGRCTEITSENLEGPLSFNVELFRFGDIKSTEIDQEYSHGDTFFDEITNTFLTFVVENSNGEKKVSFINTKLQIDQTKFSGERRERKKISMSILDLLQKDFKWLTDEDLSNSKVAANFYPFLNSFQDEPTGGRRVLSARLSEVGPEAKDEYLVGRNFARAIQFFEVLNEKFNWSSPADRIKSFEISMRELIRGVLDYRAERVELEKNIFGDAAAKNLDLYSLKFVSDRTISNKGGLHPYH